MKQTTSFSQWVKAPLSMQVLMVVFTAFVTLFFSCQKDILLPTQLSKTGETREVRTSSISIDEAKTWFEANRILQSTSASSTGGSTLFLPNAYPNWQQAMNDFSQSGLEFIVTPISNELPSIHGDAKLIIFRDSMNQLRGMFIMYLPDDTYRMQTLGEYSPATFTGIVIYTDFSGDAFLSFQIENGIIQKRLIATTSNGGPTFSSSFGCTTMEGPCPQVFAKRSCAYILCDYGASPGGVGGGGGVPRNFDSPVPGYNFPSWLTGGTSGSSGGSNGGNGGGSSWGGSQPNNLFNTDAQLISAVSPSAWAIIKDNKPAKASAKRFLTKRGVDNVAAIDNSYSFADSDPDIFNQYLGLLTDDDAFFDVNKNAGFPQVGSLAWEQQTINPILDAIFRAQYAIECAALKRANPGWSNTRVRWTAFWHVSKEIIHTGFDICGLIPVAGEFCDLTNGVFYLIEGEGVDATMSFASAIPIVGWVSTGAKYANKVVKTAAGIQKSLPYIVNATTGLISFGRELI